VSRKALSRQAKRRPHQGNSMGVSRKALSRQAKRRPHQGNSLGLSPRTLSRQAAQKCVGKGMSRHRDLPRATLSSSTSLQSHQKALLRQHFAKFHHSHPVRSTLLILNNLPVILYRPTPSFQTFHPVIPNVPPRHPKRSTTRHPKRSTTSSQTFHHVILNLFQDLGLL
jgi:hypothetical protein